MGPFTSLTSFLALCVFRSLANSGQLVEATPVADRLQQITTTLEPPFSKGLIHLSNLFDFILNYDENIKNGHDDENATLRIQTSLRSSSDSLDETENITALHLKVYEKNLLSLSADIAAKENELQIESIELEKLTIAVDKWQSEAEELRQKIADLDAKITDADHRASQSQRKAKRKRKNRWKWIVATVFTGGLASPGLILNEKDIQKLKRDRDAWQSQANERRQTLKVAENNHRDIVSRHQAIEQSIKNTRASLLFVRTTLEELRKQYSVLSDLGSQIRNIATFLLSLNGELSVIHGQQQLMVLFQPLLESIDSLISFLEKHFSEIVLLTNNEAVNKIREHLSPDLMKGLTTNNQSAHYSDSITQDKFDHGIEKLESEPSAESNFS